MAQPAFEFLNTGFTEKVEARELAVGKKRHVLGTSCLGIANSFVNSVPSVVQTAI